MFQDFTKKRKHTINLKLIPFTIQYKLCSFINLNTSLLHIFVVRTYFEWQKVKQIGLNKKLGQYWTNLKKRKDYIPY